MNEIRSFMNFLKEQENSIIDMFNDRISRFRNVNAELPKMITGNDADDLDAIYNLLHNQMDMNVDVFLAGKDSNNYYFIVISENDTNKQDIVRFAQSLFVDYDV